MIEPVFFPLANKYISFYLDFARFIILLLFRQRTDATCQFEPDGLLKAYQDYIYNINSKILMSVSNPLFLYLLVK